MSKLLFALVALTAVSVVYGGGSADIQDGLYVASWNLDGNLLYVAITARTVGYVGWGLGPHPNMTDADVYISGVHDDGTDYSYDMHALTNGPPVLDDKQDYELLETDQNGTHTFVTFLRALDTNDVEGDVVVTNTVQHVLWSLGKTDNLEHHDVRGVLEVNLMSP